MDIPETRYTKAGEVHIAYQVVGEGPVDLLHVFGYGSNVDVQWEEPRFAAYMQGLAAMGRLILFDKRGTGVSDHVTAAVPIEERMDDARAVMDAVGSERAVVLGMTGGVAIATLFAASYPHRTASLVLYGATARWLWAPDYDIGVSEDLLDMLLEVIDQQWGTGITLDTYGPSMTNDDRLRRWVARYERAMAAPGDMKMVPYVGNSVDLRPILPSIQMPTLVVHRRDDRAMPVSHGRYLAERVPDARYVELEGIDHWPWVGDTDALLGEIEEFVTGRRRAPDADRVLATVLFSDLVDSTAQAARVGDREWRALIERHDAEVRAQVESYRGKLVKTTGDGALATFDGPARGVRCAQEICNRLSDHGLSVRVGLHTGEIELRPDDVTGLGVNIAARVMSNADANEVLVSRTVVDLVVGSGLQFEDRGVHSLKGVPGEWQLYAVTA